MKTLQEEREVIVEEFFNKFFPDLADKVHQEQSDWLRTALTTIAEEAHKKGFQLGVIGSQTGDFKTEDAIEQIREEARREERERIQKSFDHWFKKGTEDVEDWAERELTTPNNKLYENLRRL